MQSSIAHLTRSSLHRCLQRRDISGLPLYCEEPAMQRFKPYSIGYFHMDIVEVRTGKASSTSWLALTTGTGPEVERPLTTVVIGGLITATG